MSKLLETVLARLYGPVRHILIVDVDFSKHRQYEEPAPDRKGVFFRGDVDVELKIDERLVKQTVHYDSCSHPRNSDMLELGTLRGLEEYIGEGVQIRAKDSELTAPDYRFLERLSKALGKYR